MNKLIDWVKNRKNRNCLRWLALLAIVITSPLALGWAVIVALILTTKKHWNKDMERHRTQACALVATLAFAGCMFSNWWCSFFGWLLVSTVMILALCTEPLIKTPKKSTVKAAPEDIPEDYKDGAIDVEFWDCDTPDADKYTAV